MTEVDLEKTIGCGWTQRYIQALKSFANKKDLLSQVDHAVFLNPSNQRVRWIFNCGQALRERAHADPVASCRDLHLQGFVRTLTVVLIAPMADPGLSLVQITPSMR